MISVVWGTLNIVNLQGSVDFAAVKDEYSFTFGQIIPIFLLGLPLLAVLIALQPAFSPMINTVKSSRTLLLGANRADLTQVAKEREQEESQPSTDPTTKLTGFLHHDYYHEIWAAPTIILAAAQAVFVAAYIFRVMSANISALKAF